MLVYSSLIVDGMVFRGYESGFQPYLIFFLDSHGVMGLFSSF